MGAMLITATFLPSGTAQANPLSEPPVVETVIDIEDEGGTGRLFEPWELEQGSNPYMNHSKSSRGGLLAAPLVKIVEPLVDIEDEGGTGRMFEAYELNVSSDLGGGITDFEEAFTNKVNVGSDLGGGITDFEEAYTNKVNVGSDLGGGITDFEEPYTNKVNVGSNLGGGITDFEEPYTNKVNVGSDLGGGITDFEEPYTSKVSSLPTQLVDIEDEGGTGRMFEAWEYSGEHQQADIFPEVEL